MIALDDVIVIGGAAAGVLVGALAVALVVLTLRARRPR